MAHAAIRALVSTIPIAGSAAAELFSLVISPPLTKRRDEWIASIAQGLTLLERQVRGFRIEDLSSNEAFITTVMQATQVALRTHQKEKLLALRNAVLNVALHRAPDEDLQLLYLSFADSFTQWHLRILKYFHEHPTQVKSVYESGELIAAYPELDGKQAFYEQIVRDLYARGLVVSNVTPGTATAFMPFAGRATQLGQAFLEFISSPVA